MLRITVDVNGRVIDRVFIHNTGKVDKAGRSLYDAATLGIEDVPHERHRNWFELLKAVMEARRK